MTQTIDRAQAQAIASYVIDQCHRAADLSGDTSAAIIAMEYVTDPDTRQGISANVGEMIKCGLLAGQPDPATLDAAADIIGQWGAIADLECIRPTCRECPYHDPANPDECSGDLPDADTFNRT